MQHRRPLRATGKEIIPSLARACVHVFVIDGSA
jgi:hypothetical protein